jgi:1-acyl-sn-glycerol-3-phosphate acyltransferase
MGPANVPKERSQGIYLGRLMAIVPAPMPSAERRRSIALSLASVYETFAISWPTVVDAALGRVRKDVCDARLASWSQKVVQHTRMDITARGREHVQPGATYLVMSNHQSHYDIPVLFYVLGANIRMITKVELFRIPIFGEAIRQAGFIAIDRSNRNRAIESLRVAKETLASGVHVWIAPEGTRSRTGQLLPFKKGGFNVALEADWPILPMSIQGTRDALRAKGMRTVPGAKVTVTIGRPISPSAYRTGEPKAAREALMRDVRLAIEAGL